MFGLREKCKERKTKREGREKELFVWLERNGGKERKMEGMNFNGPILFLSNWRKLESRDFILFFYFLYIMWPTYVLSFLLQNILIGLLKMYIAKNPIMHDDNIAKNHHKHTYIRLCILFFFIFYSSLVLFLSPSSNSLSLFLIDKVTLFYYNVI